MNKLLKIAFSFARKAQKDLDPQQMHKLQVLTHQKCQKKHYKKPQLFKHQDLLYQQQVYGNKCQISGITQNNLKSCEFTKQIISMSRPKLVILGGLNDTQAMIQLNQPLSRFLNIENLATAKLFCKSTILPIIQKRIETDRNYLYDSKTKIIWRADHMSRRYVVNDYLNAAYESMFADYKIIYGKPSSVFVFQDLMLTLSLDELRQIFENTLNKVKNAHPHSCEHQAGILLQQIKTHAMYDEPKLYSKEITYTTALLNRLTKIQPRNLLLIPGCFVKRIADQVHNLDFQPQTVYRRWVNDQHSENYNKLTEIITNKKTSQLLQKLSILSILKGSHLQLVLYQGKNFFKNSIFADLLGQYQPQQLIQMYRPIRARYMQRLFDIQNQRIKNNIEHHPVQTEYMYMKDQFETLEKRKEMFLYQFQPKNYITQAQNVSKIKLLKEKIQEIVQLQCDQYEKKLFQAYKKGSLSKQSIILYSKLIGKANIQLNDRIQLPYYHFNAFRGFYKQYLRDNILFDQDLKQKKLQMKKFQKLQHNFDKIAKKLDDPEQLRKILTGESGHKVKQLNVFEDENGDIDIDGELEDLQEIVSQMGTDEMKKDFEEFRQKYPREKDEFLDEDDDLEEDLDEDEDEEMAKPGRK